MQAGLFSCDSEIGVEPARIYERSPQIFRLSRSLIDYHKPYGSIRTFLADKVDRRQILSITELNQVELTETSDKRKNELQWQLRIRI